MLVIAEAADEVEETKHSCFLTGVNSYILTPPDHSLIEDFQRIIAIKTQQAQKIVATKTWGYIHNVWSVIAINNYISIDKAVAELEQSADPVHVIDDDSALFAELVTEIA